MEVHEQGKYGHYNFEMIILINLNDMCGWGTKNTNRTLYSEREVENPGLRLL